MAVRNDAPTGVGMRPAGQRRALAGVGIYRACVISSASCADTVATLRRSEGCGGHDHATQNYPVGCSLYFCRALCAKRGRIVLCRLQLLIASATMKKTLTSCGKEPCDAFRS